MIWLFAWFVRLIDRWDERRLRQGKRVIGVWRRGRAGYESDRERTAR